jgi:hypothetical protein
MEVLKKINQAIDIIKNSKLKKEGKNDFSNYEYYTPSQVALLVYNACKELDLFNKFELIKTELGMFGHLTVTDLESGKKELFIMASDIPTIKATNLAQQLGGAMTYTKRYLLMNVYNVVDNNLDYDTSSNTAALAVKKTLTKKQFDITLEGTPVQIQNTLKLFQMSKAQRTELEEIVLASQIDEVTDLNPA